VVDYYGDGLLAMWNAPTDQPEHAELASSAALEMLETLPCVTKDWVPVIQSDLRLGIGVHSGLVQVGNAGSTRQAKYGPRGPNVHLASRVEVATKSLGVPLIATTPTVQRLSDRFATGRICRARMPGLHEPTDLYAVWSSTSQTRLHAAWQLYDEALRHFEQGRLQEAADIVTTLDGKDTAVPWSFLAGEVQRELGREQRRRSTDQKSDCRFGVITLSVK
jgi:adenylate cyclase